MLHVAPILLPESFRLIYLDPPFLTGRTQVGSKKRWSYQDKWQGELDSYLPWLEERLIALHKLLLPDGSLVLHLDYRASHYARVILDNIFGRQGFINEIIWHYTGGGRSKRRFSCKHDTLLWYSKSQRPVFNIDAVRVPYKKSSGYAKSGIVSASGRHYRPNPAGTPVDDVWNIPIINPLARERTGYPTQKPMTLLNRVIEAMTNEGDLLGDFCFGSGTTLVCAQNLNRQWAGCDVSPQAVECLLQRLATETTLTDLPQVIQLPNPNGGC